MSGNWMDQLRCPSDGAALDVGPTRLRCHRCHTRFPVERGIPDFRSPQAEMRPAWRAAQRYELAYWSGRPAGELDALAARFSSAAAQLAGLFDDHCDAWRERALQVGPAALGEIHFLPVRDKVAVEPLALDLDARGLLRRADVHWISAMGERLPLGDGSFPLILLPNVIDHVADPGRVLSEIRRCLAPGGLVWLSSHVSHRVVTPIFAGLHGLGLGYFAGHLSFFTPAGLDALVESEGLRVAWGSTTRSERASAPEASLRSYLKQRLLGVRHLLLSAA
jgi:SAM-dependent methyltransferase